MIASVDKLALFRAALRQNSLDACIIPSSDQHLSEYIPDHWKIIPWLTGFTGSAATVIITDSFAGLWTDSRYFIQAERELADSGFHLVKPQTFKPADYIDFLVNELKEGSRIAFDGSIFPLTRFRSLEKKVSSGNIIFISNCDFIYELWNDRPHFPASKAWDHTIKYSGKGRSVKIAEVREQMKKMNADYHLLTSPDDIMWLLNIRGSDLPHSPLILCFALVGVEQILLFVDESRFPHEIASEFDRLGILMLPYDELTGMISDLTDGSSILISPDSTSVTIYNSIPRRFKILEDVTIPSRLKAIKNKTEVENLGRVMIKDGVALARFFHWIESDLGIVPMTERSLALRLHEIRSHQPEYLGPSFTTITAYNEHSAQPHYSPTPQSDVVVGEDGILLVDCGGQYPGGTTDITRTIPTGLPSDSQKKDFTLVLKGHIRLAMIKFPLGTRGYQLDILAREALWEQGLNYGHGTGHGVGYCLNVHEGPQNISPADHKAVIEPGMLISNEPGIYREGEYGIRIENLVICYEDEETEFGKFLKLDTVSLCYIEKSLIDKSLLNQKEISWLNSYHSEVYEKLSPHLTEDEKSWLKTKTEPL
jgi:Xaa-Pro aminopeptidase